MRRRVDGRLEVFGEASGSVDPAECPFDDPALRQHDEALDLLVIALDDGDGDAARLEGGALRLIAAIAFIDETRRSKPALAMRLAQEGRERVAILDVGGRDLALIGRPRVSTATCRLRPLIFLAASKPRGPPASVVLTDWLSTTIAVGAASRPSASRAPITRTQTIWVHNPRSRQA